METFFAIFPRYGKFFEDFSTVWKTFSKFFHAMENFIRMGDNRLKKPVFSGFMGCWIGAVERSTRRPM